MSEALVDQIAASLRNSLDLSTERQRMLAARMIVANVVATALAEAEARARRATLEEAAKICEAKATGYASGVETPREQVGDAEAAIALTMAADEIRALANTTPEARQPETGDARIAALLDVIEAARAEVAFAAADEADGTATQQTRRVRFRSIADALQGVGNVEARRALGLLEPPARIATLDRKDGR